MTLAIMQPYLFPYIGYFQLINVVDKFIIYDDVNFIKNGWINRNRILVNGKPSYLTIPLTDASSFKAINQIKFAINRNKMLRTIEMAYKKAPFFEEIFALISECLLFRTEFISGLASNSLMLISEYLGFDTIFESSYEKYHHTYDLKKAERLIEICKINHCNHYINPIGGIEIYNKKQFKDKGIKLNFLKTELIPYKQFKNEFIPGLSIIDVLMFNSIHETREMLNNFELQ